MIIDRCDFCQAMCGILDRIKKTSLVIALAPGLLPGYLYTPIAFPIQFTSNLIHYVKRPSSQWFPTQRKWISPYQSMHSSPSHADGNQKSTNRIEYARKSLPGNKGRRKCTGRMWDLVNCNNQSSAFRKSVHFLIRVSCWALTLGT
jgi:hypothetical protein